MRTPFPFPRAQQGSVLIIALIMLLLLIMVSLASMRDTSLQEAMAGNTRDSNLALQAAEAALRKGEEAASNLTYSGLTALDTTPVSAGYASSFEGTATPPQYEIRPFAKIVTSTDLNEVEKPDSILVKVEAVGYGASEKSDGTPVSQSQLRSIYKVD